MAFSIDSSTNQTPFNIYLMTMEAYDTLAKGGTIDGHTFNENAFYLTTDQEIDYSFLPLSGGTITGVLKQTVNGNPYYNLYDGTNNWYFQSIKADNACYIGPTTDKALKINLNGDIFTKGKLLLSADPVENLQAVTKQYVDRLEETLANFYVYTKMATQGASQIVFDNDPYINVNACLVYYNGILLTLGENYSITSDNTISLINWTANAGDIFTISGKQANTNGTFVAAKLNCGTIGSSNLPVYFKDGVPVACSTAIGSGYLPLIGGTMTGPLILNGAPTQDMEAVTKKYVDDHTPEITFPDTVEKANKLSVARSISLNGDVTGSGNFDGSTNLAITATVADNSHNHTWSNVSDRGTCTINTSGTITGSKVYGAVWNDYAEYRDQVDIIEPGYCVASTDDGKVYKTIEKFQACDGIVSDTFGFSIGETDDCKTPLAVAGRVLAYCEGDRNSYHAGDTVCASFDGKVMKMTREEIKEYPDRIIGIVSEIPSYEFWGSGNIKVNNRIWIKIK